MFRYWASIFVEANRLAWNRLFGSIARTITDLLIWWAAVVVLRFYFGRGHQMSDQISWAEAIGIAAVLIYVPLMLLYLFRVPFMRDKAATTEIDRLKALAGEATSAPSFDLGFEVRGIDPSKFDYHHKPQDICRIWVENLTGRPIENCRVVIEDFISSESVKRGARLVADNSRGDDEQSAKFTLAATERQYFKFLALKGEGSGLGREPRSARLIVESDQIGRSVFDLLSRPSVEFGMRYFATIAVHGEHASSRRINVVIDAESQTDVRVYENGPSGHKAQAGVC
jgi:hypothetical protein